MSAEDTLIQVRKDKHQEINGGKYPLPTKELTYSVANVLNSIRYMAQEGEIRTTVVLEEAKGNGTRTMHGRLSSLRKSGALTFMKLTDVTGSIQLVAARNNLPEYETIRQLDLGDIIEVTGEPVLTKTGEKSLLLSSWKVLTKSHRPPPEKFAGITDTELKYRKRYLDLMSSEESRSVFMVRSFVLRGIRSFMEKNLFMEVETSTLNTISSGANAKPFTTHHNALETDLFLRIAPELYLKRLLVGGYEKVYEIGRSYRNEGISTRHNPEFTMMEFYEAYGNFPDLITYTKDLLKHVEYEVELHVCKEELLGIGGDKIAIADRIYNKWKSERTFTFDHAQVVTMQQAVINGLNHAGMAMYGEGQVPYLLEEPDKKTRQDKVDLKSLNYQLSQVKTEGERRFVWFEHIAEPFLTEDYRFTDENGKSYSVPVFITDYPVEICPLARRSEANYMTCDRFELFVDGRELANAFQELNDPDEQARQFKQQLETNQKDPMGYDADYVEALEYGMPPAIGFGMGIDRLVMLLTNSTSIKDVILFPTLKPIK